MYVGYALYYFTRKSFMAAMPSMQVELGLDKVQLGLMGTILSLTYGASKFLSGILGDRSNPRYFMSIGLILTGIFNVLFGVSSIWWAFALFWGLNGWFQGWGWPGCAKLLTHWYSQSERGRWWSAWNTSHNVGGALIPLLAAACAEYFGWRSAMLIPGAICIAGGFLVMYILRDTPQSLGLPPIEVYRGEEKPKPKPEGVLSSKELFFTYVFQNKFIWVLAFAYFFVYLVRTAVNDWSILYLVEVKGYEPKAAGLGVFLFEIGGGIGGIAAGWASDILFRGMRNPINALFSLAVSFVVFGAMALVSSVYFLDLSLLFAYGFFIFGPQMLIGVAAAELSHKNAAATATGFIGCFAYLGAAAAGAPLGAIIKNWGWSSFHLSLIGCSICATLLLLPLWSVRPEPVKQPIEPEAEQA